MATKTFTIDTGEWAYPDKFGDIHQVTNAQTFTVELTDGGASAVLYQPNINQSVTTTDGYTLVFRPLAENSSATAGNALRSFGPTADAQDATKVYNLAGEIGIACPKSGDVQYWKSADMTVDNVDAPTAVSGTFEDQFGNTFTWTTVTVS